MTIPLPFPASAPRPVLRPYQEQALDAIQSAKDSGRLAALVVQATGTGKTILFSALVARWNVPTLILAHREELLTQARDKLRAVWPQADIGLIGAGYDERGHRITIASVASMAQPRRAAELRALRLGLVIVDEAHHTPAPSYRKVLQAAQAGEPGGPFLLGVTATPQRSDGKSLTPIYGDPVFQAGLADMVRAGYLCDLRGLQVQSGTRLDDVRIGKDGDFNEEQLAAVVNSPERNRLIVDAFQRYAADRATIVFAVDVEHAHDLATAFRARGVTASALDGTTPRDQRHRILTDFTAGRIQVLCNMSVLTEGFDEPATACLILARPTQSRGLYVQMVGRGARLAPGKKDCLILDVADNTARHSLNLMSLPKLVGRLEYGGASEAATPGSKPATEFSLRHALDADLTQSSISARDVALFADAFLWEKNGGGQYVLRVASEAQPTHTVALHLDLRDEGYRVRIVWPDATEQSLTPTPLALDWAQTIAEDAALQVVRGQQHLVDRRAPWRNAPATEKQLGMLKRLGVALPKGKTLSRGEVSDLINTTMAQQAKGKGQSA